MYFSARLCDRRQQADEANTLDRSEPTRKFVRWIFLGAVVVTVVLLVVALSIYAPSKAGAILSGAGMFCFGSIVGGLALFLVYQLSKVRRGLFSVESLHAAWRRVLLDCDYFTPMQPRSELDRKYKETRAHKTQGILS